ncbi:glutamate--cysteine ligase [Actinomadura madurae]|uniref:carboxylate-amine ligase n=1 Tax=Actinomadura madurae TaxID=1993 RepID=UPI00202735B4|nr:glutamate--cysteine ligase [Actinomadura madurae]URN03716.1 glutamate--cysteine ligase [Actinomadura madurae]
MALRFGIEEEYFVVDPVSREVVPRAPAVVRRARAALGDRASTELVAFLAEAKTPPCDDLDKLAEQIRAMRAAMAAAAAAEGVRLAATGTPVLGAVVPAPIGAGPRYAESLAVYRGLDDEQSICSCHVHVEMPDRELAVQVSNHLRPWLPTLLALSANSPYWAGRDTGHACWRAMAWARWPVAGPPPFFASAAHYDDLVGTLLGCGALMDTGTVFWDVRPSARLPTVEVRLADVAPTAAEATVFAALVRGWWGRRPPRPRRASRRPTRPRRCCARRTGWPRGTASPGRGVDVRTGRRAGFRELAGDLLAYALPALRDAGDLDAVAGGLRHLLAGGTGAERQREAYRERGRLTDVVDATLLRDR